MKDHLSQAWNAALSRAAESLDGFDVGQFDSLTAPSTAFDEWYERDFANPPDTWDSHRD